MPEIAFLPLAVNPREYPTPRLSMLPRCGVTHCSALAEHSSTSAFKGNHLFYVYGRYALVEALKRAGVHPGARVLMPAYHCRTILESALFLQAEVLLYPMLPDLSPDLTALERLVEGSPICAMLMTHYFGFANNFTEVKAFCSRNNIMLIEDCAHAFYGHNNGVPLGSNGDFAIASAWKFLPVRDGAVLRDNRTLNPMPSAQHRLHQASWRAELKATVVALKSWLTRYKSKPILPTFEFKALAEQAKAIAGKPIPNPVVEEVQFLADRVNAGGLRVSRWLVEHAPHDEIATRRRANYLRWLKGIEGIDGVKPLFPSLPEGVVPYAFPLLTDAEGLTFHALKLAGIPIWRWEDVARTNCEVSQNYRLRLLQLPCHQDLTSEQIDWMTRVIRGVMPHLLGENS